MHSYHHYGLYLTRIETRGRVGTGRPNSRLREGMPRRVSGARVILIGRADLEESGQAHS
jgi:hypothetical protein